MAGPEALSHLEGYLPLMTGTFLIGLAAFVFVAGHLRIPNVLFSAFFFTSGLKSLAEGVLPLSPELHAQTPTFPGPLSWFYFGFTCAILLVPLLILFVLVFPKAHPALVARRGLAAVIFLPAVPFLWVLHTAPLKDLADLATIFNAFSFAATALAVGLMMRTYRAATDPIVRTRAAYVLGGLAPYLLGTLLVALLEYLRHPWQTFVLQWVTPTLEIAVACIAAYAILKYQLVKIELGVKAGLKYTLTMGAVVIVFFLANNLFQKLIEPIFSFTDLSFLLSALGATVVFFPVQRFVGHGLNKVFPATTQPPQDYLHQRSRDLYHAQLLHCLRDDEITDRERRFLEHLRDQLSIDPAEAMVMEHEIRQRLGHRPSPRAVVGAAPRETEAA